MQDLQESIWDVKEVASPTSEPTIAEASCLPFCSGLGLSSAFLLCKFSNNQHLWEWDAHHFLKTHTLNYKSTYGWKSHCLSLGGGGGNCLIIRLLPVFLLCIFWISVKDKMPYLRKKIYWRFWFWNSSIFILIFSVHCKMKRIFRQLGG